MGREGAVFCGGQCLPDGVLIPDVEFALVAFGVGVITRVVTAFWRLCLTDRPGGCVSGHASIERISGRDCRVRVNSEQSAVVVQHFLEVGNHPVFVHRVAGKATAQLVVHAAVAHAPQSEGRHVERVQVRLEQMRAGVPVAQESFQRLGMRKLGRAAEAAVVRIEDFREHRPRGLQRCIRELGVGGSRWWIQVVERRHERRVLLPQLRLVVAVVLRHPQQQVAE